MTQSPNLIRFGMYEMSQLRLTFATNLSQMPNLMEYGPMNIPRSFDYLYITENNIFFTYSFIPEILSGFPTYYH